MKAGGKRATWLVLGALVVGLLLGALSNQAGDGIRQPLIPAMTRTRVLA